MPAGRRSYPPSTRNGDNPMNQPTPTRSWVASANGHADFPLQNLPLGIFSRAGLSPRCGVAIGDSILDLDAALAAGLFEGAAGEAAEATRGGALNAFFALGKPARVALRQRLLELLGEGAAERRNCSIRPPSAKCTYRPGSATTPTSTSASAMPRTSASCSARTTRCCPTTSTCPSATTAAPRPCASPAAKCAGPTARPCRPAPASRCSVPVRVWTTNWS